MSEVGNKRLVSIIAPVYNEETALQEFIFRIHKAVAPLEDNYEFEIVLVDDGSTDLSLEVAKSLIEREPKLRILELRRNYGQTAALQAGLDYARGAIIISMDADLQHFPEEIPQFIQKIEAGFDVVCGWRHDRRENILRRWPSRVANAMLRAVSGLSVHDIGTTYRAYRADVVRDLRLLGEGHRFVPIFAKMAGAKIDELKIENIERPAGKSHYGISRTLNVFVDIFFLYFYLRYLDRPVRIFGKLALLFLFIGGLIGSVLLVFSLYTSIATVREHSGWFMLSIFFLVTGIQLLLTGILAEIITRVYYSPGHNMSYQIRREWCFADVSGK